MSAPVVGFIGVLAGLLVGSGFTFWSTRRSEIAQAAVAASVLAEELRALHARRAPRMPADFTRLEAAWKEHRPALILHMRPEYLRRLADSLPLGTHGHGLPPDELVRTIDALAGLFWKEHQAFILTPLVHYLRRNTVSRRLDALLEPALIGSGPEPPTKGA